MATMYPDRLPSGAGPSERRVHAALVGLPDPWIVFHSVAWQSVRSGRQGDGEADFVLLHPDRGLIVIEAKGGAIRLEKGTWFSSGADGDHAIDPFEQAVASKHALLGYLRDSIRDLPWIEAGHAVWFTGVVVDGPLGAAAPEAIVLDRDDLREPIAAIDSIVDHWELHGSLPTAVVAEITDRLAPTVTIRHTLADDIADVRARQLALTESQRHALAGLRRARRVIVYGGAGTGKTVLAVERAKRLVDDGFRVVLTCFNRPLGDAFAARFAGDDKVVAGSFHRLAHRWATEAGLSFPDDAPDDWWDDPAGELVLEAFGASGFRTDAVIIDEGQDFDDSWFVALEAGLEEDDGLFLVFADPHQSIYREQWEPPFAAVPYDLDLNCRNTNQIAALVGRIYGDPSPPAGTDGPAPAFVRAESPEGITKAVRGTLHRLLNEGQLNPDQIVILTQYREDRDRLVGSRSAGTVLEPLDRVDEGIAVETIHRFKGLEADAAIVILTRLEKDRDRALAYIGLSRARAQLIVVGPEEVGVALGMA